MPTAAIYARVSTDQQETNYSLPTQLDGCRTYAQAHGFTVIEAFTDTYTGTSLSRPAFDRLKALAGSVDAVIVYVQDRLGRADELDTWNLIRSFQDKGTQVHATDTGFIDGTNFMKTLEMLFKARSAKEEAQKFKERSVRGKKARATAGKVSMTKVAKYGYDYDAGNGAVVINAREAAVVQDIFRWYTDYDETGQRLGLHAIAVKLTALRIPTKRDTAGYGKSKRAYGVWGDGSVHDIISDEIYAGVWYYNRHDPRGRLKDRSEWIPVAVPAIITREVWQAAQTQAKANLRQAKRNTQYDSLLRGRITCATCGSALSPARDGRYDTFAYVCRGQRAAHAADGKTRTCSGGFDLPLTDAAIWNALVDLLKHPETLLSGLRQRQAEQAAQLQPDRDYLARCKTELEKCAARRARLLPLYLDGQYEKGELDNERAAIDQQIAAWQAKIADLESRLSAAAIGQIQYERVAQFCAQTRDGIDLFTFEDKRMVLDLLDIQAFVHRGPAAKRQRKARGTGSITLTGYIPTLAIAPESGSSFTLPAHLTWQVPQSRSAPCLPAPALSVP